MTRLTSRLLVHALAVLVLASPAVRTAAQTPAQDGPRRVGFLLRMVLDFGGETVEEVRYDDGDKVKIKAGQLGTFAGGLIYRAEGPWAVEGTFGYKFDQANASNGSIKFTRLPVDVIASYRAGNHRLGAGPTLHLSPKYTCDLDAGACGPIAEAEFDTALGGILQYAYGLPVGNSGYEFGVRVTFVNYKGSVSYLGQDVDLEYGGNAFGFFFGGWL